MTQDEEKAAAARKSLEYVKDGMIVGLGSGSTATFAIQFLGQQVSEGLKIRGIPTSRASEQLARSLNIPLTTFEEVSYTDVTIDGADEVAPGLALIKGGGGALLHEKIVAAASRRLVIVADAHKIVERLGRFPLPVEVIPFESPTDGKNAVLTGTVDTCIHGIAAFLLGAAAGEPIEIVAGADALTQ